MASMDITTGIERLEVFEERLGVRLESLSAFVENHGDDTVYVTVHGELHARDGTQLQQNVELVVAAYDSAGRIVGTTIQHYFAEDFFGLDTFQMLVTTPIDDITRVRIYPKKSV